MAKNNERWSHISKNGTLFECDRCDFRNPIKYRKVDPNTSLEDLLQDVSEMIAYHAMFIWGDLNGFSGYDCVTYEEMK